MPGEYIGITGIQDEWKTYASSTKDMGSLGTGRHRSRLDPVTMGQQASDREFTPSMDYRHLLSPAAQSNLAEWEANYDQRAKRAEECEKMMANGAKAAHSGDKHRSLPRTYDLPGCPLSEDPAWV